MTRRPERTDFDSAAGELRPFLLRWDPLGVAGDDDEPWPEDEYDCLIPGIISRLRTGKREDELVAFLSHEQITHFGVSPRPAADEQFAREVVSWWTQRAEARTATDA